MATGYRNLEVWKKAKALAVDVYRFTRSAEFSKDYGLVDQLRRSAVSIASNIAEGDDRDSSKDAIRFFYVAKGSAAEAYTQLDIVSEVYPDLAPSATILKDNCDELSRMLRGLITARSKNL